MIVRIKESELNKMIHEAIVEHLNESTIYEYWNKLHKKHLTEGLTMTYSIGKIQRILKRRYNFKELNVSFGILDNNPKSTSFIEPFKPSVKTTNDTDNWYSFSLMFKYGVQDNGKIVNDMIKTCDACGWYLADGVYFLRNGFEENIDVKGLVDLFNDEKVNTPLKLDFRAKFNVEYKKDSLPPYLYHICPLSVSDKILKQGLTPRNNGRIAAHPERVYLFLNKPNDLNEIVDNFKISGKDETHVLLEIDTRKIGDVRFFYDSNVMSNHPAIYTFEPITSKAIRFLEKIN